MFSCSQEHGKIHHIKDTMDFSRYVGPSEEWETFAAAQSADFFKNRSTALLSLEPGVLRRVVNKQVEEFTARTLVELGLDKRVVTTDYTIPTRDRSAIRMRTYMPAELAGDTATRPAYLYFHGGGMLIGSLDSEDMPCALWADRTRYTILNVDYRHTPDHKFPTALHDAWDAFQWITAHAAELRVDLTRLMVGGPSAGGCLTATVVYQEVQLARREGRPPRVKGQVLQIPWLIYQDAYPFDKFKSKELCSMVQCASEPTLPKQLYDYFMDSWACDDPHHRLQNIGLTPDEELQGFPKTFFMVCGWDMLRDEGMWFADRLEGQG